MDDSWYKARHYLHFDMPISFRKAGVIVRDPKAVARHAFYPFLSYKITSKKIAKESPGGIKTIRKDRPIAFASHLDAHIYAYYCEKLSPLYEEMLEKNCLDEVVLAFRKMGKSNIDFAKDAFDEIKERGECTAIGYDLSGFFDNLDHALLKSAWATLKGQTELADDEYAVFKSLTRFSKVDRDRVFDLLGISKNNPKKGRHRIATPSEFRGIIRPKGLVETNNLGKGIPQGSPISAFLSNLYMLEFDKRVNDKLKEKGGTYYRYCDDMLFIIPTEMQADIQDFVQCEIKKLEVEINPKKTEIRNFGFRAGRLTADKPLQYLGFLFDGSRVVLRSASLAKYSERMRRGVRLAKKTQSKRNSLRILKGEQPRGLFRKKLYARYSHLGHRNFITYGLRAAKTMESSSIKRQLKPLWRRLEKEIGK